MDGKEKVKEAGLYNDGDVFLNGTCLPTMLQMTLYGGTLATIAGMTNFIIIKNSEGIIAIPRNKVTNAIMIDKKILIPNNEIDYLDVSKGNPGFYKISIMGKEEKYLFAFQISVNVTEDVRRNLDLLFSGFECRNKEIIKDSNKVVGMVATIVLITIMLIVTIIGITEEDFLMILCGVIVLGWFIYAFIKTKRKE